MTARLLKVIIQPVYVIDQGDELVEVVVQPIPMSASEWKALDPPAWAKEGAAQVDAQVAPDGAGPVPNRASRRHPPKKAVST